MRLHVSPHHAVDRTERCPGLRCSCKMSFLNSAYRPLRKTTHLTRLSVYVHARFLRVSLNSPHDVSYQTTNGTNAYAVLSSPRASGTEAIVISASRLSRIGEGDGTPNLRGIATILSLAAFLKGMFQKFGTIWPSPDTTTIRVLSMG